MIPRNCTKFSNTKLSLIARTISQGFSLFTCKNANFIQYPANIPLPFFRFDSSIQEIETREGGSPRIHCRSGTTAKMTTMREWILIEVTRDMSWKISERENSRLTDNKCILLFLLKGDQLREGGEKKKKRKRKWKEEESFGG